MTGYRLEENLLSPIATLPLVVSHPENDNSGEYNHADNLDLAWHQGKN